MGFSKKIKYIYFIIFVIFEKLMVGFQPWTCWSFLLSDLALFGIYILNMPLLLQPSSVIYWTLMEGSSLSCTTDWFKTIVVGFQPWTSSSISLTDTDPVSLYILNMSLIWQHSGLLYMNFCEKVQPVVQHCVGKNILYLHAIFLDTGP